MSNNAFTRPPEPWNSFLSQIDQELSGPVELHCLGGFVLAMRFDVTRSTGDIDTVEIIPVDRREELLQIAGEGSGLARKYKLKLQYVGVADYPENYAQRLTPMFSDAFTNLTLKAFELHDLLLAKLTSNRPIDRKDLITSARLKLIQPEVLKQRYFEELRPNIMAGPIDRHDTTLTLWLQDIADAMESANESG